MRPERRFLFRLSLEIGIPIKLLLKKIDSQDITEYKAYYQIEPFGVEQDYIQSGIISSVIANVNKGKNSPSFKPSDFIPPSFKAKLQKKQSPDEIKQMFEKIAIKKPRKGVKNG